MMGAGRRFAIEFDGLLWTEMDASQALCAVVAAVGFAIGNGYIALWAYFGTDTTADAFVAIYSRCEQGQCLSLYGGKGAQGSRQSPPRIVATVDTGSDVGSYAFKATGIAIELPHLVVGVAAEAYGTIVRHTYLVAVGKFDAPIFQHLPHSPYGVASLRPAGYDDEDVGIVGQLQARQQFGNSTWCIEPITGEYQAYAALV